MATHVKATRFSDKDVERSQQLLQQLEGVESEAELLLTSSRLGMRLLAASARQPGYGQYAGYAARDLARQLRLDILPVLDFLAEQGELPALFGAVQLREMPPAGAAPTIQAEAAAAVNAFSGGFLDD